MNAVDEVLCDLRHGVQLGVWNTSGRLDIRAVGDFLAEAEKHFKHHRDSLKTDLYDGGPYEQTAVVGEKVLGRMRLSCVNKAGITSALWADAVIDGYTNVNTVEQMLEELPAWRKAIKRDGGYLREVVALLGKRGGDLLAMAAMIKHARTRDGKM